jgi:hypothetical protein
MSRSQLIHLSPPDGSCGCPCCGTCPLDLPRTDCMTFRAELVTCKGKGAP